MTDPTQTPPFAATCRVIDGTVTELTGYANAYWTDANGCVLIPDGVPVDVGWLYNGDTFSPPPTPTPLPAQEA